MRTKAYRIDISQITDAKSVDLHTIDGRIAERHVRFQRRMEGWRVDLEITIDGHLVHRAPAGPSEVNAFNALFVQAFANEETKRSLMRRSLAPVLAQMFPGVQS